MLRVLIFSSKLTKKSPQTELYTRNWRAKTPPPASYPRPPKPSLGGQTRTPPIPHRPWPAGTRWRMARRCQQRHLRPPPKHRPPRPPRNLRVPPQPRSLKVWKVLSWQLTFMISFHMKFSYLLFYLRPVLIFVSCLFFNVYIQNKRMLTFYVNWYLFSSFQLYCIYIYNLFV